MAKIYQKWHMGNKYLKIIKRQNRKINIDNLRYYDRQGQFGLVIKIICNSFVLIHEFR